MHVIVGTAGHIDHGKTALIKALTGTDADRLPEEKRRGITVDLGFAAMTLGGDQFDFVDVPGHERFVKNMLAGASGIDLVMLVIAADEGVMPQTREHFDICRLLDMHAGVVVLTKSDLADADTLELARLEVGELVPGTFLEKAPVVAVSSRTGEGIEELKSELSRIGSGLPGRKNELVTRLPIDRSFSVKGFGAVVTGTLASGEIREGDELAVLQSNHRVRVRGLQTHGQTAPAVSAGRRVAVNLGGIDHSDLSRGMLLTAPEVFVTTQIIDAEVQVLPTAARPLRSRARIRFHIGTTEALARVQVLNGQGEIAAGEKGFVQIRLETPVIAVANERFIIRSYSPQATIAGGTVIDPLAARHRKKDSGKVITFLSNMLAAAGDHPRTVDMLIESAGKTGLTLQDLQRRTALKKDHLSDAVNALISRNRIASAGNVFIAHEEFDSLSAATLEALENFHRRDALARGMSREALAAGVFAHLRPEVFSAIIASLQTSGKIVAERDTVKLATHAAALSPDETVLSERLFTLYKNAGLEVPKLDDALAAAVSGTAFKPNDARRLLQLFLDRGELVKVTDEFYFLRDVIDELAQKLRDFASASPDRLVDVPAFKQLAGVSRKFAIPLLEYFDRERVTRRAGDKRQIL